MKTFRKGGIHPHDHKLTADCPVIPVAFPSQLFVPLSQSIGKPAKCIVKPGDIVEKGDLIGEADGFISSNVASPVKGTVKKIDKVRNPQGLWLDAVMIDVDPDWIGKNPDYPSFADNNQARSEEEISSLTKKEIVDIVAKAGIVGLGGATFPTNVKLTPPPGKIIDTVVINGAECEPYLTCDDRLMRERPKEILAGIRLLMRAVDAQRAIIGIEDNKPQAAKALQDALTTLDTGIEIAIVKKKYPQGSEKQLIKALTDRTVPCGALPAEVGVLVDNVATAYALYDAAYNNNMLTSRLVTVSGDNVSAPGNFLVAVGTPIDILIEKAGGIPDDTGKMIAGGPMMGRAFVNTSAPATKGLSGILLLSESHSHRHEPEPCIRCARCVEGCPMGLEPYLLAAISENLEWEMARDHGVANCIECGCCSWSCPASRPLLDRIRLAKQQIRKL